MQLEAQTAACGVVEWLVWLASTASLHRQLYVLLVTASCILPSAVVPEMQESKEALERLRRMGAFEAQDFDITVSAEAAPLPVT